MKLVETDVHGPKDDDEPPAPPPTPPRPEHRRVSVSLLLTASVLIGTVVMVYVLFPERHNVLMSESLAAHRSEAAPELEWPSEAELGAWSLALVGKGVQWPAPGDGVEIVSARSIEVLQLPTAIVRYRVDGEPVTLVVQRTRDAVPRKHRRVDGAHLVLAYRRAPFSYVAVGPAASEDLWRERLDVP
jgi:hypothetical protein